MLYQPTMRPCHAAPDVLRTRSPGANVAGNGGWATLPCSTFNLSSKRLDEILAFRTAGRTGRRRRHQPFLAPRTNRSPPATTAATPAHIGTLTDSFSFTDSSMGPS